jgi:hypothetical protein
LPNNNKSVRGIFSKTFESKGLSAASYESCLAIMLPQLLVRVFVMVNGDRDGVVEFSGLSRGWIGINRCVSSALDYCLI